MCGRLSEKHQAHCISMYLLGFSIGVFGEEALVDDARGRSNLGELGGVYSDFVDVAFYG